MSGWIKRLKVDVNASEKSKRHADAMRLHSAEVIRAKMPKFWQELVDCLKSDVDELRGEFADIVERQCSIFANETTVSLVGQSKPYTTVTVTLNLHGMCLDSVASTGHRKNGDLSDDRADLNFLLNGVEGLFVVWGERQFAIPTDLSEALIRRACNIEVL